MRVPVSVTQDQPIAAAPAAVWAVVSDPAMHERLDRRVRLERGSGVSGEVGSHYEVSIRSGVFTRVRLRYDVVEAQPQRRLAVCITRGGRPQAEQLAELIPRGDHTLLRWTAMVLTASWARRLVEATNPRQLKVWLAAVEREALLHAGEAGATPGS